MPITSTDPLADMLTRIRNAIMVRKTEVLVPHSKVKESVADLLSKNGFIAGSTVLNDGAYKLLKIVVNKENASSPITEISRLSTPGRRWYVGADAIPVVKRGRGIVIISTSKGLMTGEDAKKQNIGGELICKVY